MTSAVKTDPAIHRSFYINGKLEFAFFLDDERDINKILANFYKEKDFIHLQGVWGSDWANLGLVKYNSDTNEIFLEPKKAKSLASNSVVNKIDKPKLPQLKVKKLKPISKIPPIKKKVIAVEKKKAAIIPNNKKKSLI